MSFVRFLYDPRYSLDDFNRLVDETFEGPTSRGNEVATRGVTKPFRPMMDVHEDKDGNQVVVTVELPGLKKSDVQIDIHGDRLVVSGETASNTESDQNGYSVRERRYGKFSRTLALPKGTKPEHITAKMEDGILKINYPKTQPDQTPARITIG